VAGWLLASHALSCVQCMESYGPVCVWGLFINVDAWWVAGWLPASHTLGYVEYNLYYMLNVIKFASYQYLHPV